MTVVGEPIERAAIDALLRPIDGITDVTGFLSLNAARAWIDGGANPVLVLLDAETVGTVGAATVRILRSAHPQARLVLYGVHDMAAAGRAMRVGLDAVIAGNVEPDQFAAAIRFVLGGSRYVSPEIVLGQPEGSAPCALLGACGWAMPFLESLPIGVALIQEDRTIYVNTYIVERFGWAAEQLREMPFWNILEESHRARARDMVLACLHGDESSSRLLLTLRTPKGERRWAEAYPRAVAVGGVRSLVLGCIDVSARMSSADRSNAPGLARIDPAEGPVLPLEIARLLTNRQREVLRLLGLGDTNKQIAAKLGISHATVKLHVHHLMRSLGVSNRTRAVLMGRHLVT